MSSIIYVTVTATGGVGATGVGVPTGGTLNQAIVKNSATDYDTSWKTVVPNGGTTGQVLAKTSNLNLETAWTSIVNLVYPVGAIYMSVSSTSPNTLFGGTWVAWGSGRVPVGVDAGQTEFDTVEETGGAKTHTLTEAEMPSHEHTVSSGAGQQITTNLGTTAGTSGINPNTGINTFTAYKANAKGGGLAHNNLQPYITCYMWKRTA